MTKERSGDEVKPKGKRLISLRAFVVFFPSSVQYFLIFSVLQAYGDFMYWFLGYGNKIVPFS